MGFASVGAFDDALRSHRATIAAQFADLFGDRTAANGDSAAAPDPAGSAAESGANLSELTAIWRGDVIPDAARQTLGAAGFADPADLLASLERVRKSPRYAQLPALSRQRFDLLVPQLLQVASHPRKSGADAQTVFQRLFSLLETVSRRSAYLALIIEHPPMLPRLAQLLGASQWAADYLTRQPILLDELLDAPTLLAEPDWDAWRAELARLVASHAGDAERQMDALRHFKHAQTFRLLAQDLAGKLSVERLADHLSMLADIILGATLAEVWAHAGGGDAPPKFAIIGYGKLGGKELGYASDLDLVFLYDDAADESAQDRYTRLARRLITWLTTMTPAGQLYDIDTRLRPDGAKGLMSSSLAGFRRYEREHAWTWEHQALTRARFVAGDAAIGAAFERERESILCLPRDHAKLKIDVIDMRRRMLAGHANPTAAFDIKHDPGGMVDVEFSVQYLVLAYANDHDALTRNLGNIALLGIAADLGLLPAPVAAAAADTYREYRRLQHRIRLTGATHARVDPVAQADHRAAVAALWSCVFGEPWR